MSSQDNPEPNPDQSTSSSPTPPLLETDNPPPAATNHLDGSPVSNASDEALLSVSTPVELRRPNWPLRSVWTVIVAIYLFYVVLLPELQIAWHHYRSPDKLLPPTLQHDLITRSVLRTLEAFVVAFFFAVGASIGSFLNVVAYRLPNNLDISVAGSRCPKCGKRLNWKENMPLFGWLSLRGQCSGCRAPISIKYLIAELLVGGLAVWLGSYELLSGGINLPIRTPNFYAGVVWIIFYTKWDVVSYTLFHFAFFAILATQLLILHNGFSIPKRFLIFALTLGVTISLVFPWLLPLHSAVFFPGIVVQAPEQIAGVLPQFTQSTRISVANGIGYSFALSLLPALWAWFISGPENTATSTGGTRKTTDLWMWFATFAYCGIWFGWQATIPIAIVTLLGGSIYFTLTKSVTQRAFTLTAFLLSVTVVHHTFWSWIVAMALRN